MKKISFVVLIVSALILMIVTNSLAEKRTALVIGNGAYKSITSLNNPVNDAVDMKSVLTTLGFDVILRINANRGQIKQAVRTFESKIRRGGVGLFYYAGHGVQVDGTNYIIPVGVDIKKKYDVEEEALKMRYVLGAMEEANNDLNIVILDACRNNPFRSFRGGSPGLARMDAPKGSIIAYATSPGAVAEDGSGRNGTYTAQLLKHLVTPGLSVQQIFNKTGRAVMKATNDEQIPWISSTPLDEFYLVKRSRPPTNQVQIKQPVVQQPVIAPQKKKTSVVKKQECVQRDGRFCKLSSGPIQDTTTGLIWASTDNGQDINWKDAKRYCETYSEGGFTDWRMPTIDELAALYDKNKGYHTRDFSMYKAYITQSIQLTTPWLWSSNTRGSKAAFLNFGTGTRFRFWYSQSYSYILRVLPVRVSK